MATGTYDIVIQQGETWSLPVNWKDSSGAAFDLSSNYTARMQARRSHRAEDTVLDINSDGGGAITLLDGSGDHNVEVLLTDAQTAALPAPFEGVYDLELVDGAGTVTKLLKGKLSVYPEVTR